MVIGIRLPDDATFERTGDGTVLVNIPEPRYNNGGNQTAMYLFLTEGEGAAGYEGNAARDAKAVRITKRHKLRLESISE